MKDNVIIVEGEVIENLPNTLFRVKLNLPDQGQNPKEEKIIL